MFPRARLPPYVRFRSLAEDTRRGAWGLVSRLPLSRVHSRDDRVSQVPGRPSCVHATFLDPGGTFTPGHCGVSVRPSALRTASASTKRVISGLTTAACTLPMYASRAGCPATRNTRFRLVTSLCRTGFTPAGSLRDVSSIFYVMLSPSPRLCLAHSQHRPTNRQERYSVLGCPQQNVIPAEAGTQKAMSRFMPQTRLDPGAAGSTE